MRKMYVDALNYDNPQAEQFIGSLNFEDAKYQADIKDHRIADAKGIRYWISPDEFGDSALKVVFSPKSLKMFLYNSRYTEGNEVEGVGYYKIAIG